MTTKLTIHSDYIEVRDHQDVLVASIPVQTKQFILKGEPDIRGTKSIQVNDLKFFRVTRVAIREGVEYFSNGVVVVIE